MRSNVLNFTESNNMVSFILLDMLFMLVHMEVSEYLNKIIRKMYLFEALNHISLMS